MTFGAKQRIFSQNIIDALEVSKTELNQKIARLEENMIEIMQENTYFFVFGHCGWDLKFFFRKTIGESSGGIELYARGDKPFHLLSKYSHTHLLLFPSFFCGA